VKSAVKLVVDRLGRGGGGQQPARPHGVGARGKMVRAAWVHPTSPMVANFTDVRASRIAVSLYNTHMCAASGIETAPRKSPKMVTLR
jgi:hypothetical protein